MWAPPYAEMLVRARLAEHPDIPTVDLRTTTPRELVHVGPFSVEPLRVTHSIPDATALCIGPTPAGRIFHTGDFKFEEQPLDGQPSDEDCASRSWAKRGLGTALGQHFNIDVPGRAGVERMVARLPLERIITRENGRGGGGHVCVERLSPAIAVRSRAQVRRARWCSSDAGCRPTHGQP